MKRGALYLIPSGLGNIDPIPLTPPLAREAVETIELFLVEQPKTAAQFLSRLGLGDRLQRLTFVTLDDRTEDTTIQEVLDQAVHGRNIGVISEAGCPGIADPGAQAVRLAHQRDIRVVPLVGPSSITLALMASGLNGQSFVFHGYLPQDRAYRIERIRRIEHDSGTSRSTQIFIEAPHRNDHLLGDLLHHCKEDTLLCVAVDLTLPSEAIRTFTIGEWRKQGTVIGKRPAVFLLQR